MLIFGGLVVLGATSLCVAVLAAVGLARLKRWHAHFDMDPICRQLEHDLVMAIGMTAVGWTVTAAALLWDPALGATPFEPGGRGYSVARGTIMLAFWHAVGSGAFLLRRAVRSSGTSSTSSSSSPIAG